MLYYNTRQHQAQEMQMMLWYLPIPKSRSVPFHSIHIVSSCVCGVTKKENTPGRGGRAISRAFLYKRLKAKNAKEVVSEIFA